MTCTKHTSSIGKSAGKYRFYNSSQNDKLFLDEFEIDEESLIIGNGGSICVHIDKKFTASKHVTVCQINDKNCMIKYLYYYLLINVHLLKNLSAGSTITWLNKTNMRSLLLPIPGMKIQKKITESLDIISDNIQTCKKQIEQSKEILKRYIESETMWEKKVLLKSVCDLNLKNISKDIEYINYIDIGSIENNNISEIKKITADYPSRAKRLIHKDDILLSTVRPNLKTYTYIKNIMLL